MLILRPYQQAAIASIYGYFQTHKGNPLVVIPTAGGKSASSWLPLSRAS
jgi:DNA repair protein RadD